MADKSYSSMLNQHSRDRSFKKILGRQKVKRIKHRTIYPSPKIPKPTNKKNSFFKKREPLILLTTLLLGIILSYSFHLMSTPAKNIIFKNDSIYTASEITNKYNKLNFKELNSFSATTSLNNKPWLIKAKLKKFPPQVVGYFLKTRQPWAVLLLGDKKILIDQDLTLIDYKKEKLFTDLPLIKIEKISPHRVVLGTRLDSILIKSGIAWIKHLKQSKLLPIDKVAVIDVSDPYDFLITIKKNNTNITIHGTYNNISQQLERLSGAAPLLIKDKRWRNLDLRVDNRVILSN